MQQVSTDAKYEGDAIVRLSFFCVEYNMVQNNWFQTFKIPANLPTTANPLRLYTFHHAGGSCQYFQPWAAKLPSWISLISIQLPGRWNRVNEPAYLRMGELIPVLGTQFKQQLVLHPDQLFAFYGHSLGGLVAYELTRYLIKEQLQLPVHLFISSKRSLQNFIPTNPIYKLPMSQFETMVSQLYGALPSEVIADPDMKAMFLDITKKDMELLDTYIYTPDPKINVPLTVMRGLSDHVITLDTVNGWKDLTSADCEIIEFAGDHFFLKESESELLKRILDVLAKHNYTNLTKAN